MSEAAVPVLIIAALVLINALFVAAEFAIVGAPRANVDHLAAQGSRLAARVARILAEPQRQGRFIATTQVGISAASLGLGMYGEQVIAGYVEGWLAPLDTIRFVAAHALATGIAVGILTYVHIVIGEMVPKGLALQSAMRTAMYVSPIIEALEVALLPLVVVLNAAGNALLAVIGIKRQQNEAERYHTSEELQMIIEESHERGLLRGESGRILRELFEFGNLTAGEVMVPRVRLVGIAAGMSIEDAQEIIRRSPHTRYPVYAGDLDHIEGSVHIKTLLRHIVALQYERGGREHHAHLVVGLVSHSAGEAPHRFHLLHLAKMLFDPPAMGDVMKGAYGCHDGTIAIPNRCCIDTQNGVGSVRPNLFPPRPVGKRSR